MILPGIIVPGISAGGVFQQVIDLHGAFGGAQGVGVKGRTQYAVQPEHFGVHIDLGGVFGRQQLRGYTGKRFADAGDTANVLRPHVQAFFNVGITVTSERRSVFHLWRAPE